MLEEREPVKFAEFGLLNPQKCPSRRLMWKNIVEREGYARKLKRNTVKPFSCTFRHIVPAAWYAFVARSRVAVLSESVIHILVYCPSDRNQLIKKILIIIYRLIHVACIF